jgi:hypothetical protein
LISVEFEGKKLKFEVSSDRKSIKIVAEPVTATAGTKELVLFFKETRSSGTR